MKSLHMVTFVLLVVGGLNWLLVAFGYNLVDGLLGEGSTLSMLVYILVGLSAVHQVVTHKSHCRACGGSSMGGQM
ncbi:MAG: hypothetical protein CEO12_46 [Parcubacteria group bacterium Gr01-1014_46]|nr:MAG: hypothetical protein CEO12_46 [Parcubacteria group bacterium Gr01-1014_46]